MKVVELLLPTKASSPELMWELAPSLVETISARAFQEALEMVLRSPIRVAIISGARDVTV